MLKSIACYRAKTFLQIILNSMHKFQPRIHLILASSRDPWAMADWRRCKHKTFVFPETVFTAVTAYQNQLVSNKWLI